MILQDLLLGITSTSYNIQCQKYMCMYVYVHMHRYVYTQMYIHTENFFSCQKDYKQGLNNTIGFFKNFT